MFSLCSAGYSIAYSDISCPASISFSMRYPSWYDASSSDAVPASTAFAYLRTARSSPVSVFPATVTLPPSVRRMYPSFSKSVMSMPREASLPSAR